MEKLTIHESSQISVWCYPKLGIVHHQMHTFCHGAPFREALDAGTAALRQHGAHSWLSDDRNHYPLPAEDEAWGSEVWFPRTKAYGWKHWAIVRPEAAVGRLNSQRILANFQERGINAHYFEEFDDAFAWLRGLSSTAGATATR